jgi:anionic cell wall polymer biosynthesis LytR-Cps2A-Psr (LCP) family protein
MITSMAATTVPVPIDIVAGQQTINGDLKIGFGAAAGLDQGDAGRRVRNKDVTQTVAAVATELSDLLTDITNKTGSGTQLHDLGIHSSIITIANESLPARCDGSTLRPR